MAAMCTALVVAASVLVPAPQDTRPEWPGWRGPDGDGIPKESGWSAVGKQEPAWRVDVGTGYSNVAIVGRRLVTLGHDGEAGEDRVLCLDRDSGEELWRHAFPAEAMANFHTGGTLTTPAIDGGVVFVTQRQGRGMALDLESGAVLWERNYAEELGLPLPEYGFSGSPLPLDGRVYFTMGGTTACVSRENGDVVWHTEDEAAGYSTPAAFSHGERDCLAAFTGRGLVVLDRAEGEELGHYPFVGERGAVNAATPVVRGNQILVSSGYEVGAGLVSLTAEGAPEEVWRSKVLRNKVSGCTLWEDHVYGFDEAILKCIDWSTGEERWRVRGMGMGAVTVADGRLLVLTSRGELVVAEASREGFRELSRRPAVEGGVCWTAPVLCDGRVFCRSSAGDLVCLDHTAADPAPVAEASIAGAAAPGEALPPPPAESLFEGHLRAIGGERLRERESLHLEGQIQKIQAGVTDGPLTIDVALPDRWKLEYDMGLFGKAHTAHDGEHAWAVDPFWGNRLLEGEALVELLDRASLHRDLLWRERYPAVTTVGRATFDRRDCWLVEATTAAEGRRKVYFEVESGLLAGRDALGESRYAFDDYRDFDGVLLPTRVTVYAADTGEEEVHRIEKATWDAVPDETFAMPEVVLPLLRTPEEIAAATAELEERYAAYIGTYDVPEQEFVYRFFVAEGELKLEIPAVGPFPMAEPDEQGRFYFPPTQIYATFEEEEGAIVALVMHDAPNMPPELRCPRVEDE